MKIRFPQERDISKWHSWFAWYPVKAYTNQGEIYLVWLETIERSILYAAMFSVCSYRFKQKPLNNK